MNVSAQSERLTQSYLARGTPPPSYLGVNDTTKWGVRRSEKGVGYREREVTRRGGEGKRKRSYPVPRGTEGTTSEKKFFLRRGLLQRDYLIDRGRGLEDVLDDGL